MNLHKIMAGDNVSPDFGFDVSEIATVNEVTDPWVYMCNLL